MITTQPRVRFFVVHEFRHDPGPLIAQRGSPSLAPGHALAVPRNHGLSLWSLNRLDADGRSLSKLWKQGRNQYHAPLLMRYP
jgi:hypothetical protein